jgi:hypothetical protein
LYAAFPGGFVIPCFEPVMITLDGCEAVEWDVTSGSRVLRPWITPKRFTSIILWK